MKLKEFYVAIAKAKTLGHAEAPGLLREVEGLCKQAGTTISAVQLVPTKIVNAAFMPIGRKLLITEGMLDLFGDRSLHLPPSAELKAVIGHELCHAKYSLSQRGPMLVMLAGIPLAGAVAMYLIDKTQDKLKSEPEDSPKEFWPAFQEVWEETKKKGVGGALKDFYFYTTPFAAKALHTNHEARHMTYHDAIMREAKYWVVNAAMLAPALAACRPFALKAEFDCDRFAVALTKDNKPLISAFEKLVAQLKHSDKGSTLERWLFGAIENTISAHPPMKQRIHVLHHTDPRMAAASFGLSV